MHDVVSTQVQDDVLVVTIDNPPVNALSPGVAEALASAVSRAIADSNLRSVIVRGAGRTFVAGADIKEFPAIMAGERPMPDFHASFHAIESSPKPVIVLLHGSVLGGGLELAMAGHYRLAVPETKLGQPEVKLGLIPGAGGTQRLPRLVGIDAALEMCAFGESIDAARALELGLIDAITDGDPLECALAFARTCPLVRRTRDSEEALGQPEAARTKAEAVKAQARRRLRGQTAPLAACDAVCAASELDFEHGIEVEARLFGECLRSEQAHALIHVFFAEREVARVPGLSDRDRPGEAPRLVGVVGAGTMGTGIAQTLAQAGLNVLLRDADPAALERSRAALRRGFEAQVQKGRLSAEEASERLALIQTAEDWAGFESCDLIIEAVSEDLELKKGIFAELDSIAKTSAVLASNTSTLDIDALARCTRRADRVVGIHFFSPAPVMRLVEAVRGAATSTATLAMAVELARRLKKTAIVARNSFGFIGNRMFVPYRDQAVAIAEEGASPWMVDRALVDWGWAMGPLAVGDLSGLDVFASIRRMERAMGVVHLEAESYEDRLAAEGRWGQKSGAGWYVYGEDRVARPDPDVEAQLRLYAAEMGIPQREYTPDRIVERCMDALINEGARLMETGVASRAVDIDMVYLHGYGFPRWRGGPMWYASQVGKKKIHARLERRYAERGPFWKPSAWLLE